MRLCWEITGESLRQESEVQKMPTKILTVDDSKTIRQVVEQAFRSYDCMLSQAGNGQEALAIATIERPDLILLDVTMPVMDGITMLGILRRDPQLKATPILMLTAESRSEDVARLSELGVSDFLFKPFREDVLLSKVRKIITLNPKAICCVTP